MGAIRQLLNNRALACCQGQAVTDQGDQRATVLVEQERFAEPERHSEPEYTFAQSDRYLNHIIPNQIR